jgi:hypothetical protein
MLQAIPISTPPFLLVIDHNSLLSAFHYGSSLNPGYNAALLPVAQRQLNVVDSVHIPGKLNQADTIELEWWV